MQRYCVLCGNFCHFLQIIKMPFTKTCNCPIRKTIESETFEKITISSLPKAQGISRTSMRPDIVGSAKCSETKFKTQQSSYNCVKLPVSDSAVTRLTVPRSARGNKYSRKSTQAPVDRTKWLMRSRCSGMWTRVLVLLTVCLLTINSTAHAAHSTDICQETGNAKADKICSSMDLRNTISALKKLCRCRIIDGHLHFVLQEQRDNTSVDLLGRYTFPGLREITHHLLMYRVFNLTSLRWLFPNLAVIRGSVLFHNYALVIYDMPGLRDVGLVSLTAILRGSVRIERNPRLCYLHTVDWSSITLNPLVENYVNRNRPDSECPPCTGSLRCLPSTECGPPRCWGPYDCQTLCGECPGGCVKGECCHEECVGGCLTPNNATSCHACRNVLDHDTCVPSCTSPKFKVSEHRCEPREVCSVNYAIKRDTQECVERCPTGYNTTTVFDGSRYITQCDPCKGMVCTKRCSATTVKSISHAQLLRGCTIINDFLTIYINGGENMERELEENLSSVEEITGYLKVFHSNLTSLKFLRNLKTIHGQTLAHGKYSLVIVDNPRLESVWNTTNLTIIRGLVLVQFNPRLCLHHLHTLINNTNITGLSENDVSSTSNGDKVPCNVINLNVNVSTSPLYGTLSVTASLLPDVSIYYVSYKKTDKNISLYESEEPCSDQGWSTMEMAAGVATGLDGTIHGTIVNLEPYTRYAVYVKTYSLASSAKGGHSDVVYATTSPYNPTEPVHLGWESPNSSSLELWWEPPRRPNGLIDHYLVTVTLLVDTPRIPPDLDFCNHETRDYVDTKMVVMDDVEGRETVRGTTQPWKEPQGKAAGVGSEDSCSVTPTPTPSCCPCQDAGAADDQEVIGQIGFEDFIMDNVYIKKIQRSRRAPHGSILGDEEFETTLRTDQLHSKNTLLKTVESRVLKTDYSSLEDPASDGISRLLPVPNESEKEFPFHHGQTVHEFPSHAGIQADYQAHEENLTHYDIHHPQHSWVLVRQVHMTQVPHLSLQQLLHYSVYVVEVVACHGASRVPVLDHLGRLALLSKLCSSLPARVAAYTRANGVVDDIPEGSLRPLQLNNSSKNSLVITWDPPKNPNGGVVAYILKIQSSLAMERCVNVKEFESLGRRVKLPYLSPGNYSVMVKVRSKAMYGNFSAPTFFVISDDLLETDVNLLVTSIVVMLVGTILAGAVCWCWRRYTSRYTIPDTIDKVDFNPYYSEGFAPAEIFREEFILWRDDLKVLQEPALGNGFFGKVLQGELTLNGQQNKVAVKTHRDRATTEDIHQFLKEAALMQDISCHHVVRLLGVVGDYAPVYVVMELMQEGDLKTFLNNHPPNFLTCQKMMEMAVEAADGMAYLAACKLVHRDLAARNCMLDHNLTLKIGDFGLTRNLKAEYYRKEGHKVLPVKWMAPESLQFSLYSTQSDVWSYGVLLWEMATRGVTPYKNHTNDEVIRMVVERYTTLGRPRNCPQPFQRVMRRCWRYQARERPSFLAITNFLLKHTSTEYQKRFEKVSFYHSRSSNYCRYKRSETTGFMSECARESDEDDHSNDLALQSSSEVSDADTPENDFVTSRSTPHGSPISGKFSPGQCIPSRCPGRTFNRNTKEGEELQDTTIHGRWSGVSQESVKLHLYKNVISKDSCLQQLPLVSEGSDGFAAKCTVLPIMIVPQDDREIRGSQLQMSTLSTPASNES